MTENLNVSDFAKLEELRSDRWNLLDEVAAIDLVIAALIKKIRGE